MKLSDLRPGDVAVFVRADGSESEPFVVTGHEPGSAIVRIQTTDYWARAVGFLPVRRLGRGRLVPARIVMEGEADLVEQVAILRKTLQQIENMGQSTVSDHFQFRVRARSFARAALAATAPKEAAK